MTDKPIIFGGPMVRALLEGRKTQTRRLLSIKGKRGFFAFGVSDTKGYDWTFRRADHVWEDYEHDRLLSLLPIAIGDRLYVREAHYLTDDGESEYAVFAADQDAVDQHLENMQTTMASHPSIDWSKHLRLRPSIHMPRWASRLTLTVTDVRVQRLQDITEADAMAEGIQKDHAPGTAMWGWHDYGRGDSIAKRHFADPRDSFRTLWNSIHGPEAWAANPWVAAYTFTVQHGNIDEVAV